MCTITEFGVLPTLLYFQSSEFIRAKCVVYLVRVVCVGGLILLRSRSSFKYSKPIPKTFGFKYIIYQDSFFQRAVLYNYKDRSASGPADSTMSSPLPARQRYYGAITR